MPYCTDCGRQLRSDGVCPAGHRDDVSDAAGKGAVWSRLAAAAVTLVLISVVGAIGYGVWQQSRLNNRLGDTDARLAETGERLDEMEVRLSELSSQLDERLESLDAQLADTREQLDDDDVSAAADEALASVFTVESSRALGSAFAVGRSGDMTVAVTNYHVVADQWQSGNRDVTLRRGDGTWPGWVVEVSIAEDLAAIEVDGNFPPLPLSSQSPAVGGPVIVIGSPFGLEGTVTTGVVSARRGGLLQISAAISPGSSGGPVITPEGQVVGVATVKLEGGGAEGLGFAVPTDVICRTVYDC